MRVGILFFAAFWVGATISHARIVPNPAGEKKITRPKWNEKRVAFEMRAKEWKYVFEWFSDQAGLPFSTGFPPPTGTFTFINPKVGGKAREYTLAEIFDIFNEVLQSQHKLTLLRRENSLCMFPADEVIPGELVRRLADVKDLDECANTEIVQVVVRLDDAAKFAPDAKKLLGDRGVVMVTNQNTLVMQADVASLRRALQVCDRR